jgi:hypothetical protein
MRQHSKQRVVGAMTSAVAWIFLSTPVWAQSPVTVEGTYRASAKNGGTAVFMKTQGAEKTYSIGNTKMKEVLTNFAPRQASSADLSFVLLGNPNNPNGGLLTRFEALSIPGLDFNINNSVATDFTFSDTMFPTNIYTLEYDGFADFPKYPLNVVADLNAFAGLTYIFNVDFADFGLPQPNKLVLKEVKFTLKKPGKITILDSSILMNGKPVPTINKIDLSQNQ